MFFQTSVIVRTVPTLSVPSFSVCSSELVVEELLLHQHAASASMPTNDASEVSTGAVAAHKVVPPKFQVDP